ncbi:MAG TPA: cupin domain-containing protein [Chloroflexota bacterium]|nr:cupin domain-containing protein [Chloroflexota bacterium]
MPDSQIVEILAPDGIIIRPIPGVVSAGLMSVVVGVIPPQADDYPVHFHYALEQVTYVLHGELTASYRRPGDLGATELLLRPGQALTTPPTTTLSFRNRGPANVEVLFICVPAYPASNADTELVGEGHRALSEAELRRAVERQRLAQECLLGALQAQAAALRWWMPASTSDRAPTPRSALVPNPAPKLGGGAR